VETTKYTKYTEGTGRKQTRAGTNSAAAVGGYHYPFFVCFVYFVVSPLRRSGLA
jgi:hypothetical protein